jgi:hypothetical protein
MQTKRLRNRSLRRYKHGLEKDSCKNSIPYSAYCGVPPKKPEYLSQSGRPLFDNGSVTTSCTTVSEYLNDGLGDTIWKRSLLGNGRRRFHCNDKQLFPKKRRETLPAQRRCFRERINSVLQEGVLYAVGKGLS